MGERQFWVGFNLVSGVGPARVRRLLERFGTLADAWRARASDLRQAGLDQRALDNLRETRKRVDLDAEMARLDKLGIAVLTWDDEDYPALLGQLREIDHAPPVIYLRGSLSSEDEWALTVVGMRAVSAYGKQVTYRLAGELAANGLTIVSGLARGVDAEAHRAALEVGGRTIGVLPCGLDDIYPPEHRNLAAQIIQNGALMSIFPLDTPARKEIFPVRNQVMSGLGRGVLVTEASEKSGSMLTVTSALEQGREVFAVPGNITAQGSSGTNRLVQDGAHPVTSAQDVLDVLNLERVVEFSAARASLPSMSEHEAAVYGCLSDEPLHIDALVQQCGMPVDQVSSTLTMLVLKGMAREVEHMTYVRH
jgi:DNA processing protein